MAVRPWAFRSPAETSASTTKPVRPRSCPRRWLGSSVSSTTLRRRIPTGLGSDPGETLILLGDTRDEFDGSIWAQVTADHLGGFPPRSIWRARSCWRRC